MLHKTTFSLDQRTGLIEPAMQCPSPNFDARPDGVDPSLIVIHSISLPPGEFGGSHIRELFCNQLDPEQHPYFTDIHNLRVSAHLLIDRSGQVTQFVSLLERAWHAGQSSFRGCDTCNDYSIGIELEGVDTIQYTDEQYAALIPLLACIQRQWPAMSHRHIAAHSDIAPGRKTDPGPAFDWFRLYDGLHTLDQVGTHK